MCKTNWFLSTNKHQFDPKRGTSTQTAVERTGVFDNSPVGGGGYKETKGRCRNQPPLHEDRPCPLLNKEGNRFAATTKER